MFFYLVTSFIPYSSTIYTVLRRAKLDILLGALPALLGPLRYLVPRGVGISAPPNACVGEGARALYSDDTPVAWTTLRTLVAYLSERSLLSQGVCQHILPRILHVDLYRTHRSIPVVPGTCSLIHSRHPCHAWVHVVHLLCAG